MIRIGVMGERDGGFAPHYRLENAVRHSASRLSLAVELAWIGTAAILADPARALVGYAGLWAAPGNLASVAGALAGIRFARERSIPFFGTCGGFQHAVLEFAKNVLQVADAAHEAYEPSAARLFVTALACSIKGQAMPVRIVRGSRAYHAYGADEATEEYYCSHGINPQYEPLLQQHGLRISGRDAGGGPRILELAGQAFYVATLFVPQTRSTESAPHPLITQFLSAAAQLGYSQGDE
jgi:CTP synthase (UTP-ammonia lyase)